MARLTVASVTLWTAATLAPGQDEYPVCTPGQDAVRQFVTEHQLGLAGRDPAGHEIGAFAGQQKSAVATKILGRRFLGGRNWFPADVVKKTLCGTLDHLSLFGHLVSGAESDFHPHILPGEPFAYLRDDLRPLGGGSRALVYGEVTLPQPVRRTRWFDVRKKQSKRVPSCLDGGPMCVYGPWVWEEFHDNLPEVHPSEQLWFVDPATGDRHWLLVQDASGRFREQPSFCAIDAAPDQCKRPVGAAAIPRPWAPDDLTGELWIAVEVPRTGPVHDLRVEADPAASESPTVRTLSWHGTPRLRVSADESDGVKVVLDRERGQFCTSSDRERLFGYVVITSRVNGAPGYRQLTIRRAGASRAEAEPPCPSPRTPTVTLKPGSLRRIEGRLMADFLIEPRDAVRIVGRSSFPVGDVMRGVAVAGAHLPESVAEVRVGDGPSVRLSPVSLTVALGEIDVDTDEDADLEADLVVSYEGGEVAAALMETMSAWRNFSDDRRVFVDLLGPVPFPVTPQDISVVVDPAQAAPPIVTRVSTNCRPRRELRDSLDVCLEKHPLHPFGRAIHDAGKLGELEVRAPAGFRGSVGVQVTVRDPFGGMDTAGRWFSFSERRAGPPPAEDPLSALLDARVGGAWREVWNAGDLRDPVRLARDAIADGSRLCGEYPRRARLFRLYALAVGRDGVLDHESDVPRLKHLLHQAAASRAGPGAGCSSP